MSNFDEDKLPGIKERVKEKGYNFVYGYDSTQAIGRAYGAAYTPEFFVIDKERNIRYAGPMDDNHNNAAKVKKHYLKDALDAVLAGKEVAEPSVKGRFGCGISYNN